MCHCDVAERMSDIIAFLHDFRESFIDILELDDHQEILCLEKFEDSSREELRRKVVEPADLHDMSSYVIGIFQAGQAFNGMRDLRTGKEDKVRVFLENIVGFRNPIIAELVCYPVYPVKYIIKRRCEPCDLIGFEGGDERLVQLLVYLPCYFIP